MKLIYALTLATLAALGFSGCGTVALQVSGFTLYHSKTPDHTGKVANAIFDGNGTRGK